MRAALHPRLALFSLLGLSLEAASVIPTQELTAMMLTDYIQFFHHQGVCIVASEVKYGI